MSVSNLIRVRDNVQSMIDQGAPESDIDGYLKTEGYTPKTFQAATAKYAKQVSNVGYGPVSEALSGLTFGFGDELRSAITGEPIEAIQESQRQYREQNPVVSTAANIAGSLPTLFIPGAGYANVFRGVGMAGKAARGLGTVASGATYGGLTGAGESVSGERGAGAAQGATIGAVTSPIGAAVGRGVQAVASKKAASVPADLKAQAAVLAGMRTSGINPSAYLPDAGPALPLYEGQYLAELSPALSAAAGYAVRKSPDVAGRVNIEAPLRQAQRQKDIATGIQREVGGTPQSMFDFEEVLDRMMKDAAPYYKAANEKAGPIYIPSDFAQRPSVQSAIDTMNKMRAEQGLGPINISEAITLDQADLVKRAMDDVIYNAKMPQSNVGKNLRRYMDDTRRDFVRLVDEQAPSEYRQARAIFESPAKAAEALEEGYKTGLKMQPEEITKQLSKMGESESQAFRIGVAQALKEKVSGQRKTANVAANIVDRPTAVGQIEALGGKNLIPELERQSIAAKTEQAIIGGSQTAPRQAYDKTLDEAFNMPLSPDEAKGRAVTATLDALLGRFRYGGEQGANELGNLLLRQNREGNIETMRRLSILDEMLKERAGMRAGAYGAGAAASGTQFQGLLND